MPDPAKVRGYVLCTYKRSGSTFFTQLMASTGMLGVPDEWFYPTGVMSPSRHAFSGNPDTQAGIVPTEGMSANGVYGFKMFVDWADHLAREGWASRFPNLKFVHLDRRDRLARAISEVRAVQTGMWHSTGKDYGFTPTYDRQAIERALVQQASSQARWMAYFALNGIEPLTIFYEDLIADPQYWVERMAAFMEVEGAVSIMPDAISLHVQRSDENEEWKRRFLAESRGLDRVPDLLVSRSLRAVNALVRFVSRLRWGS